MPIFPKYINDQENLLEYNNLDSFDKLWSLKCDWFEEPNYRRNGWSGVCRIILNDEHGKKHTLFLKRQENHNHRSLLHPITGIPTFRREFINLQNLKKAAIPSLEPVFYAEKKNNDSYQAVILTKALEGYCSLEEYFEAQHSNEEISTIMENAAVVIRKLHNANYRHGCLYPKHIFVNLMPGPKQFDIRIIDLEKMRWLPIASALMLNDISRLIRRRSSISTEYIPLFLSHYLKGPGRNLQNSTLSRKLSEILEKEINKIA